jgi:hypothetical protein
MSDKQETEKGGPHLVLLFEGTMGRRPRTDQELKEWLASPGGKIATLFELTSLARWGDIGRS